jgi:hypothetical protein
VPSNLSLRDLLAGARKRELIQLFQHRACQALLAAMAGVILLLLLGTQILEWYWVALVAVVGLAVGIYRIRREIPSLYELAQRIDRRLRLADTLSTAFFFSDNPDSTREAICQEQRNRAETTARDVDLRAAVPFRRSRWLLPAGGLALVAMGLFAVRYMVTGSMDLQPSLVSVAMDNFFGTRTEAKNIKPDKGKFDPQKDADSPDNPSTENEQQPEDLLSGNDSQDPTQGPDNSKQTADAPPDKKESPDQTKNGDEQPDGKDSSPDDGKQQSSDKQDKSGNQNSKDSKQGTQSQSMMDKLKDAVQNIMDSMKSQDPQESQQNQKDGKQQQQKSDQQKGKNGDQTKSDSQSQANADQQSQEGAQQQSDSKSNQKSQDKSSQQDAKNGAGSQDGDKLRRQAEELQAMGKISQILGQRSQNITGEVTVEVGNSKQQLKTAWSQSQAAHHDAGGEVPRDEVPLIYQEFVRQYFEEIHKPLPQAAKPAPKPAAQNGAGPSKSIPNP